jgi:hypothetical protein
MSLWHQEKKENKMVLFLLAGAMSLSMLVATAVILHSESTGTARRKIQF